MKTQAKPTKESEKTPKAAVKKAVASAKVESKPASKVVAKKATKPAEVVMDSSDASAVNQAAGPRLEAIPPRAVKPSSRLAQLTVPSMPQTVASTAAKSSYLQSMPPKAHALPIVTPPQKDPKLANNWKKKEAHELTDAEVLAMPDGEYMNEKQLAFFRHKLVQLKQDIHNSAGETTEHLREDTVVVPDPADRATIEEEHALELRTRDRERKLLKKIEQSIARIDAGDYGYCDETGEPIGLGRLMARPTATLSLEAQQRRELKQKMFGD